MLWWQIVLVILGAIAIGVIAGLLIDYLIRQFRRKGTALPVANHNGYEASPKVNGGSSKPTATPIPLLSRRSIMVLSVGLIVGAILGFGYWASIPSINSMLANMRAGALSPIGAPPETGPHESSVMVQLVSPGYSYVDVKDLQHQGEYYAAKANAFPFLQFLSQELAKEGPQHSYTVDQLDQMIMIRYDYNSDAPALEIRVTGNSDQETTFLAAAVPKVFIEFLVAEEDKLRLEEYQGTLTEIETTRTTLLEAQKKLGDMELQAVGEDLNNNPDYLALNATVEALKLQLSGQAVGLASIIALGDTGQAYTDNLSAFQRTAEALAQAQKGLATLKATTSINRLAENVDYQTLKGKVDNLSRDLASLSDKLVSLSDASVSESEVVDYLAVGNPTLPVAVPPERTRLRNALMLGAIIGLAGAWLGLNFRRLTKRPSTGPSSVSGEDEENSQQDAEESETESYVSEISELAARRK